MKWKSLRLWKSDDNRLWAVFFSFFFLLVARNLIRKRLCGPPNKTVWKRSLCQLTLYAVVVSVSLFTEFDDSGPFFCYTRIWGLCLAAVTRWAKVSQNAIVQQWSTVYWAGRLLYCTQHALNLCPVSLLLFLTYTVHASLRETLFFINPFHS